MATRTVDRVSTFSGLSCTQKPKVSRLNRALERAYLRTDNEVICIQSIGVNSEDRVLEE